MNKHAALTLIALILGLSTPAGARAQALEVGTLPTEKCSENTTEDQRYWYPRVPPYVGYSKGEQTSAGGEGFCYIGFPYPENPAALIVINGAEVELSLLSAPNAKTVRYGSKDKTILVDIHIIGSDITCDPDADKCCGDYTYADITVTKGARKKTLKAAKYEGG